MPRNQNLPPQGNPEPNQPRQRRRATSPAGAPRTAEEIEANEQRRQADRDARQAAAEAQAAAAAAQAASKGGAVTPPKPNKTRKELEAELEAERQHEIAALIEHHYRDQVAQNEGKKRALEEVAAKERARHDAELQARWEASLPHGGSVDERLVAARAARTQAQAAQQKRTTAEAQHSIETARKRQATIELGKRVAESMKGKVKPDALLTVTHPEETQTWRGTSRETKVLNQVKGWKIDYDGYKAPGSHYMLLEDGRLLSILGPVVRNGDKDIHHVIADENSYSVVSERPESDFATPPLPRDVQGRGQRVALHEAAVQAGLLARYAQIPEDQEPPAPPTTPMVPVAYYPAPAATPNAATYSMPVMPAALPIAQGSIPVTPQAPQSPWQYPPNPNFIPLPPQLPPSTPVDPNRQPPAPNPGP